jgi:DNA-directed RNA polymerase subunit RPC12/RpoP
MIMVYAKEYTSISCPYCQSTEVIKEKIPRQAYAICILLLGFPLPFLSKTYHCFDCYRDFKLNKQVNDKR